MLKTIIKCAVSACLAALAVVPSSARAESLSIRALASKELRLATVAYRIAIANADACVNPRMMTGLILHDLTLYEPSMRGAVSRAFKLDAGFGVLGIVPGSPASAAGLEIDDEILSLGSDQVADAAGSQQGRQSYDRMNDFQSKLDSQLQAGPTVLLIRRAGQLGAIRLSGEAGCGGTPILTESRMFNAWSDGHQVVLSTEIVDFARSDDELAFVLAHEMAHNILGHSKQTRRDFLGQLGLRFARVRKGEVEADFHAVALMTAAGYSGHAATRFLQNARRRMGWQPSLDHPGFGRRLGTVAAALQHLDHGGVARVASASAGPKRQLDCPQLRVGRPSLGPASRTRAPALCQFNEADRNCCPGKMVRV